MAKDILEEFKLECELRRLTPRTIKGYYNSTLLFLTWLERQSEVKELEDIRPQHIKMYIQYLIKKQLNEVHLKKQESISYKKAPPSRTVLFAL